jgi:general secretion pathway protein G
MSKKGFTLIELLVVISIISLLSSIVISSVNSARAKGRDTAKVRTLQEVRNALQLYYTDHQYYTRRER